MLAKAELTKNKNYMNQLWVHHQIIPIRIIIINKLNNQRSLIINKLIKVKEPILELFPKNNKKDQ